MLSIPSNTLEAARQDDYLPVEVTGAAALMVARQARMIGVI